MFVLELKKELAKILRELKVDIPEDKISIEHPSDLNHGDYSTNVALQKTKGFATSEDDIWLNPPKIMAKKIVEKWKEIGLPEFVEKVEVAGPGFINIWLKFECLISHSVDLLNKGFTNVGFEGKTMVIDYSAPNIAKPFGVGHLRSTNIGQALYNLYKFLGWKTVGDNHIGDWGTQFGKLIYKIKEKVALSPLPSSTILYHPLIEKMTIGDLEKLYVEFHKEAEKKPELEEEARRWFKKLEDGDSETKEIWQACVDISLKEFGRIYGLLGVKIDYAYGESFYLDKMGDVLKDCEQKGLLEESEGAKVIEIPEEKVPAMLVKSDGATTYFLRDLATIKFRMEKWKPDLIIYEVGADQTFYFRQLFKICVLLGYGQLNMFVHVPHGLIRWKSGKFSTRKGMTIHLEEVLAEAIKRAEKLCETAGVTKELSEKEREKVAKAVGIGAIKYNDLKQNPTTDIIFDWDQMLSLSGNSGPYLQYTFARTQSVLEKKQRCKEAKMQRSKDNSETMKLCVCASVLSNEEIVLLRTIYKFPESVAEAAQTYSPNLVCNFLFDLAQKFNLFYDKERIIGSENEAFRLLLTASVGQVLKNGLALLGIEALERM